MSGEWIEWTEQSRRDLVGDDPDAETHVAMFRALMELQMSLSALREEREVTQNDLAQRTGMSRRSVSRIERQSDVMLSTLARYVAGLGAKLEVTAVFDDGESRSLLGPAGDRDEAPTPFPPAPSRPRRASG